MRTLDRLTENALEMDTALAYPAPTNTVQVIAIDQAAQRRDASRPILVHVVERHARVKPGAPAEFDAAAQPASGLHRPSSQSEANAASPFQAIVLRLGVTA